MERSRTFYAHVEYDCRQLLVALGGRLVLGEGEEHCLVSDIHASLFHGVAGIKEAFDMHLLTVVFPINWTTVFRLR